MFQRAIDKALTLLNRNGLKGSDLAELVLVGGPTMSPILRELITSQIREPNTDVDPMTAVAGGRRSASTIEVGDSVQEEQKKKSSPLVAACFNWKQSTKPRQSWTRKSWC